MPPSGEETGAGVRRDGLRLLLLPFLLALLVLADEAAGAGRQKGDPLLVKGVTSEGACAVYGMSAEQSQLLALQKARASAIEQAAGVRVASSTLVRDSAVAVDLIRTYTRGYIVSEKVEWLPLAQYQDSPSRPPIPEYRVRVTADIVIPNRLERPVGLRAKTDNKVYRRGEKARVEITADREARVAIFNLTADDRVVMIFPHRYEPNNLVAPGKPLNFPGDGSRISLVMQNLPGHSRDAEAFFIVAVGKDEGEVDFQAVFSGGTPLSLPVFFEKYVYIAARAEELILPYTIEENE